LCLAGAPDEFFDKASGQQDEHFKVWPENWNALTLFLRCDTQWRFSNGVMTGLDYPSLVTVLNLLFPDLEPTQRCGLFSDIQLMESTVLEELANERH